MTSYPASIPRTPRLSIVCLHGSALHTILSGVLDAAAEMVQDTASETVRAAGLVMADIVVPDAATEAASEAVQTVVITVVLAAVVIVVAGVSGESASITAAITVIEAVSVTVADAVSSTVSVTCRTTVAAAVAESESGMTPSMASGLPIVPPTALSTGQPSGQISPCNWWVNQSPMTENPPFPSWSRQASAPRSAHREP